MRLDYATAPEHERRPPLLRYPIIITVQALLAVTGLAIQLLPKLIANTDPLALTARTVVAVAAVTSVYAAIVVRARYRRAASCFRSRRSE